MEDAGRAMGEGGAVATRQVADARSSLTQGGPEGGFLYLYLVVDVFILCIMVDVFGCCVFVFVGGGLAVVVA
ncbi:hypothetical protein BHS07_13980 [Myxococcus xanthus]|nr:hypothetical protein BHS07_13980 [Myxococcus xanthus]